MATTTKTKTKSKEYIEGWNANVIGKKVSNPYPFKSLKHDDWQKGWKDCQKMWIDPNKDIPEKMTA